MIQYREIGKRAVFNVGEDKREQEWVITILS